MVTWMVTWTLDALLAGWAVVFCLVPALVGLASVPWWAWEARVSSRRRGLNGAWRGLDFP